MTAGAWKPDYNPRWKQLGFTLADYDRMLAAQGGHCAKCPSVPKTRRLHVHHNYQTRKVISLLCFRCNRKAGPR